MGAHCLLMRVLREPREVCATISHPHLNLVHHAVTNKLHAVARILQSHLSLARQGHESILWKGSNTLLVIRHGDDTGEPAASPLNTNELR